jgi:voltage-dependent potassium channel beta subunit
MEYVSLGTSGLKVSRMGFGNWITSADGVSELTNSMVKAAWKAGINFFDTAEAYDNGMGEIQLGNALIALGVARQELVVTTKLFHGCTLPTMKSGNVELKINENQKGTSRKHLLEGMTRSLKNMQLDYVDIIYCHRYDVETSTEEVCHAMKYILNKGQALYWGTSEWPAQRLVEAMHLCDKIGCPRPIVEQPQYNIAVREKMEIDYNILFDEYGLGTTIWSPLFSGILSGKYNDGTIPDGTRFDEPILKAMFYDKFFGDDAKAKVMCEKLRGSKVIADELGCSQAAMFIAWTMKYKNTSCVLLGASKLSQLEDNLKALDVVPKLTPEVLEKLEALWQTRPVQEKNYLTWQQMPNRR